MFSNSLLLVTLKDKHLWQLKLSGDGSRIVSAARLQGVNYGRLRDLCISPEGKIYITTSNSNADGAGPFIDKIVELTAEVVTNSFLTVFPNPASTEIFIALPPGESHGEFQVSDALGKKVMSGQLLRNWTRLQVNDLPAGVYVFHFSGVERSSARFEVLR